MLKRVLEDIISKRFFAGKTVLLLGARQVGKTTLLKQFAKSIKEKIIV
jgi:predicted AAA+ superfamily ATPase